MHLARAHEGTEVFSATRRSTTKIAPENCRLRVGELAATRRAYARSAEEFLAWCASMGVSSIAGVRPVHAATWIEAATREPAAPSVKQRLTCSIGWSTARSCRSTRRIRYAGPGIS
jgi:hypothetical protein